MQNLKADPICPDQKALDVLRLMPAEAKLQASTAASPVSLGRMNSGGFLYFHYAAVHAAASEDLRCRLQV